LNLTFVGLPGGYGRPPVLKDIIQQPQNFRKRKLSSIEQMAEKTATEKWDSWEKTVTEK
jgi:hypothetical protein